MNEKPLIRMVNISKRFGAVEALKKVNFEVGYGEIVGLVGDNGAGKSTLVKISTGAYTPDEGEIFFEGEKVKFIHPLESRSRGIEMIYQDLALAEDINIAGNIFLGRELKRGFWGKLMKIMDIKKMEKESQQTLKKLKISIPSVKRKVRILSGGQRKSVAIGRAICWNAKIVIMDEPTAALGLRELNNVLELIKRLKERGVSVVFISHNLQEIFSTVDRIVALRSGELAGVRRVNETTQDEIARLMIIGKSAKI